MHMTNLNGLIEAQMREPTVVLIRRKCRIRFQTLFPACFRFLARFNVTMHVLIGILLGYHVRIKIISEWMLAQRGSYHPS